MALGVGLGISSRQEAFINSFRSAQQTSIAIG
jgi:hypothetical protein